MKVVVYGKEGCALCEGSKDKLKRMGVEFDYHDLQQSIAVHDGWRDDGTVAIMAGWAAIDNFMPLIMIDDVPHRYENFVSVVRAKQYAEEVANEPALPAVTTPDKVLALDGDKD